MSRPGIEPGPPRWEASTLGKSHSISLLQGNSYSEHLDMSAQLMRMLATMEIFPSNTLKANKKYFMLSLRRCALRDWGPCWNAPGTRRSAASRRCAACRWPNSPATRSSLCRRLDRRTRASSRGACASGTISWAASARWEEWLQNCLFTSVGDPDPGLGAFLTPGSGIRDG